MERLKSKKFRGNQSILLLTDGEFTDDDRWAELESKVKTQTENSYSFRIHTISIQSLESSESRAHEKQMKILANWTGGSSVPIYTSQISSLQQLIDKIVVISIEIPKIEVSIEWLGVNASQLSM